MIPLYGFLQGDTIGLLVLGREDETVGELADRLQASAAVRVAHRPAVRVVYKGRTLNAHTTLTAAGLAPLERFDVVADDGQEGA
jgi:hypothetical protein